MFGLDSSGSRQGHMEACSEYGNAPSRPTFLVRLANISFSMRALLHAVKTSAHTIMYQLWVSFWTVEKLHNCQHFCRNAVHYKPHETRNLIKQLLITTLSPTIEMNQCSKRAGIPHRNFFLFLNFIPALININYIYLPFSPLFCRCIPVSILRSIPALPNFPFAHW
jgi:hypothetical protein